MTGSVQTLVAVLVLVTASVSARSGAPAPMEAVGVPDATITITGGVVALGVGYEWARGTLTYQGQTITFWVRGVSVMDIGAAKLAGVGEVFNLKSLADFEGNYAGTTFGSAVSRGASLALIKNEKGVTIRARAVASGVRFNFSGSGMRIRLTAPPKVDGTPAAKGAIARPSLPRLS
jgi:outer membrane immunogenic protein